ncbi:DNA sulfur modification protein DndB [Pseudoalteromonas sp.]|uniref:DNA sulfur modification protein DndB n=1 Tax=Pseudoalteromonas sp. TaxID=53249 RepID=UPI00272C1DE7|nr:DNA sulfur modification protein DndB [Pseudoalteromonas sp.]
MDDYKYRFDAILGHQNGLPYYIALVPFRILASMVELDDHEDVNKRSQRELSKPRAKAVTAYLVNNYGKSFTVIPPVIGFFNDEFKFEPVQLEQFGNIGKFTLSMDLKIRLFDGQHRTIGIKEALQLKPEIAGNMVPIMFFVGLTLEQRQQAFHDINFTQKTPAKALCISYNGRSEFDSKIVEIFKQSEINSLIEYEKNSTSGNSPYLYSLKSLKDYSTLLLGQESIEDEDLGYLEDFTRVLFNTLGLMTDIAVLKQTLKFEKQTPAASIREDYLVGHVVMLKAFGLLGKELRQYDDWPNKLLELKSALPLYKDDQWIGRCLNPAGKLKANNRAVHLTYLRLKVLCNLPLSEEDETYEAENLGDI